MLFHQKFPNITVAVGEERLNAIPQLLFDKPNLNAIILDDAFQHRIVNAGLNILLPDYSNLYTQDYFLPTGDFPVPPTAKLPTQINGKLKLALFKYPLLNNQFRSMIIMPYKIAKGNNKTLNDFKTNSWAKRKNTLTYPNNLYNTKH